ncbi:RraA family protein [Consotaella salsifontis]|uniref:Putative 4-hydroxy-4-methyl-2-oxoglutarate aldolase n=1 Tax=Consotaella salsifontis TaxID=1365950 RepID=A0A1T4TB98_9HYPH|nr:RraA family protein [Consotaella salsifontis]SKA37418.1 Regulator of RNase E activity RraA [Consotaella salsifontis]
MGVGFRIKQERPRPRAGLVEAFAALPLANISDNMSRMFAGGAVLRPLAPEMRLAGVALTVRTRPGDNLMMHKAIDMAEPGDVVVVDAGGDLTNSLLGEIMIRLSLRHDIAGWIIDGAVRDTAEISRLMPVYARGISHRGPYKDGPGEINVPVAVGGMIVHPGDVVLGDGDGVLCVPLAEAEEILELAQAHNARERVSMHQIEEGTFDRSWIDRTLKANGCRFE